MSLITEESPDGIDKLNGVEWFGHVSICPCFNAGRAIFLAGKRRQHYDRDMLVFLIEFEETTDFISVHLG